jgi:endonuclease III
MAGMGTSETKAAIKKRANKVRQELKKCYPDAFCALNHETPLQLLVATILSAQCTDARVNLVTPALFARFPDAKSFAAADIKEIEKLVQSTGFFRNKAKNIHACCTDIVQKHGGEVPARLEDLVQLAGVGRKTANVVLGDAFGIPGITVDTHVGRLSGRLALSLAEDPVKIEFDLMAIIPQPEWTIFSHRMIFHGRQVCHSRKPDCGNCTMRRFCPSSAADS